MDEDNNIECVKCGDTITYGAASCGNCTWPLALEAWSITSFEVKRVTIDTGCINVKQRDPDLNTLEHWAAKGLLQIERSDALIRELRGQDRLTKAKAMETHPEVWAVGFGLLGIDTFLAGPDLSGPIKDILFPTTQILNTNQQYDTQHLKSHVLTGGDLFVTKNPRDFLVRGKKDDLAALGIWVFEPSGVVQFLQDLYGWDVQDA